MPRNAPTSEIRIPFRIQPMLATLVREPFHRAGWVYEEKYDGYRIIAYKEGSKVTLLSRNGKDRSLTFPGVAAEIRKLRENTLVLDGEVVAFDRHGVSRFQLLQRGDVVQTFVVFDCLYRNGRDLRQEPLSLRRQELEATIPKSSSSVSPTTAQTTKAIQAITHGTPSKKPWSNSRKALTASNPKFQRESI